MYEWTAGVSNTILFVMVDSAGVEVAGLGDGYSLELCKPGSGFQAGAGVQSEIGNGWYQYESTEDEADTLGCLAIRVTAAGCMQQNLAAIVSDLTAQLEAIQAKTDLISMAEITVLAPFDGATLRILRGDTLNVSVENLGYLAGYTSIDFSVKTSSEDTDDEAILRVRKNASGVGDGLLRVNGALAADVNKGSITISDLVIGNLTITVEASITDDLYQQVCVYDIQMIAGSTVTTLTSGRCEIIRDVTRAVE